MTERYVGVDVGAETIKAVELTERGGTLAVTRHAQREHTKEPARILLEMLADWSWDGVTRAAVCGRFARLVDLPRIPTKQAQTEAARHLHGVAPMTVVSIGSHGFSVLELRGADLEVFRENSRCSQGTGNFLRQLVERFDLTVEEASALADGVADPAPLSGRCPVILKTDMTHLANKGEERSRIVAGLYDAVCENVQVLLKPSLCPPRVLLTGGVTRATRVRRNFEAFLALHDMVLLPPSNEDFHLEALGAALCAAAGVGARPPVSRLLAPPEAATLDRVTPLAGGLGRVRRMPPPTQPAAPPARVILGFDIGSTGSKVVALDATDRTPCWEGYLATNGDPVGAAQRLMRSFRAGPAGASAVLGFGATGSGREIVGSLLATCYGTGRVFVLNEIAAHAEGALHHEPRVDTIFEIGGQDAKYIRLVDGRVVDAAMNEACSAGTGSFIEEQGRRFAGIRDVAHLGETAMEAPHGVSLGQHCSVFMAEVLEQAVSTGESREAIIAGLYHSIIGNYMDRVKGNRSVGQVIFCQGMPFAADALAAAVAQRTGSEVVVPPSPGTVGALGIALLAARALPLEDDARLDPALLLEATVSHKDTFVCKSTRGCGGSGNSCRIDRLTTEVAETTRRFTWGGGCSLWERGTGKSKLPDLTPDPFRQREDLVAAARAALAARPGAPRVAMADAFMLKGLLPFFATFVHGLGFEPCVFEGADHATLKRGIEGANVPFCAPMQQYHGMVAAMAETEADYLLLPMMRDAPRVGTEPHAAICPIVQGSPDIVSWDLGERQRTRLLTPVVDLGTGGLDTPELRKSCLALATTLGVRGATARTALASALAAQQGFEEGCIDIGRAALAFAATNGIVPVVVLGRPYTIYNRVLNSNVPTLLREQGALAIPVDCYPIEDAVPVFPEMYWSHGQRNLRAAHSVRRAAGRYAIWCSNYSCGPDSFNLHFFAAVMQGKPFAVIETDGHAGDAGTKTRVEAFLHCVRQDLGAEPAGACCDDEPFELTAVRRGDRRLADIRARDELVLIPPMGPGAEVVEAAFDAAGIRAEALPEPDAATVRAGRRHTSGKECLPLCVTLGSILTRLEESHDAQERFAILMPTTNGPCRFGAYASLERLVLDRLGYQDRVGFWAPDDNDYFNELPAGFTTLVFAGITTMDMLLAGLHEARPAERTRGAAQAVFDAARSALREAILAAATGDLTLPTALLQVGSGRLFGLAEVLRRAAGGYARARADARLPTVAVVGEIYVRCDAFSNDRVIERLERHGIRARLAPVSEWLEYTDYWARREGGRNGFAARLSSLTQQRILARTYAIMAAALDWPARTTVKDSLAAAEPYVRRELGGEAVLTLGGPLHEWRHGAIDGVVSVGPLECMPTKIAESQFFHVAEQEGLLTLTLPVNGDPVDPETIEAFAYEVKRRFQRRSVQADAGTAESTG